MCRTVNEILRLIELSETVSDSSLRNQKKEATKIIDLIF